jgi:hypothetical protein
MDDEMCDTLQVVAVDDGLLARCSCGWASAVGTDGREAGERWDHHRGQRVGSRPSSTLSGSR